MKIVTIKRGTWARGNPGLAGIGGENALLLLNGHQCCLGFAAEAFGVPREKLLNVGMPFRIGDAPLVDAMAAGEFPDPEACMVIAITNDCYMPEAERESELREAFARFNIDLRFEE